MLTKYEIGRIGVIKYSIKITTQLSVKWALEDELQKLLLKK